MEKEGPLPRPGHQTTKGNDLWEKGNKVSGPCRSPSLLPERVSRPRCVGAGETQVDFQRWVNGVNSPGSPRQLESVRTSTWAKHLERLHWFKRFEFLYFTKKIKGLIVQKKKKKNRERQNTRERRQLPREWISRRILISACVWGNYPRNWGWGDSKRRFPIGTMKKLHDS